MDWIMPVVKWLFVCGILAGCSAKPEHGVNLGSLPKYFELRESNSGLLVTIETHDGFRQQTFHDVCDQTPVKISGQISVQASICPSK
jgi:hypothetical protein